MTDLPSGEISSEPAGHAVPGASTNLTRLVVFRNGDPIILRDSEPESDNVDPNHQNIQDLELGADLNYQNTQDMIADNITDAEEKHNRLKRGRKRKMDSLTLEAVEKFFGKPIEEAAKSLDGNRSTLKRFCPVHDMTCQVDMPSGEISSEPSGHAVPSKSTDLTPLVVFRRDSQPESDNVDPNHQNIQDLELGADLNYQNTQDKIAQQLTSLPGLHDPGLSTENWPSAQQYESDDALWELLWADSMIQKSDFSASNVSFGSRENNKVISHLNPMGAALIIISGVVMDHEKSCQGKMDHGLNESEPRKSGSFSHISSTNSSFRRRSFNRFGSSHHEIDDDSVSEAGDIGDRALSSRRYSESGRPRFSFDNTGENVGLPIQEHPFKDSQIPTASPASPGAILLGKDQNEECKKELPWYLTYMSSRVHLAVLGILGLRTALSN
ncbi:hypothetical protein M8C21_001897 [Ambrosia artemisiifolia]|uniref:Uncharacterized protein n=1 Tax=Ambrosia artemisiifolia TaxID=4212 RepID=A0AAD5C0N9_AMBAR|nr:hypothetical protein M8C21_001897 [Ambrosia artemisiifolia]